MKRIFNYLLFSFILTFLCVFKVNAECTYQERKNLLNEAKNVEIIINPKAEVEKVSGTNSFGETVEFENEVYSYDFIISNLSSNLYIRYYNDMDFNESYINYENLENGIYTFNDNNDTNFITYVFEMRSLNNNCVGDVFYTKRVIKPIYNYLSSFVQCQEDILENNKYCKKFITEKIDLSDNEFIEYANNLITSEESVDKSNDNNLKNIFLDNWYWFLLGIVLIVLCSTFVIIKIKKRGELE